MAITFHNDGSPFRLARKRRVAAWVADCISLEGRRAGDIAFVFCSPEKHLDINRTYLGHDYATDVITFDYSDPEAGTVSGDIFIDPATVADNAARFGAARGQEMLRVMIHGILHLCGYGDKTPKEQRQMRTREDECLARFPD